MSHERPVGRASAHALAPHTHEFAPPPYPVLSKGGLTATLLFALFIMTALVNFSSATTASQPPHAPSLDGWQLLAPLPDLVGFGGMFAGVLDGRLVAGGGSQFRDKPNWLQGEKVFSDRIFVLATPAGTWSESTTRLPVKMGHFASVATHDAIYLIGGINAGGCLSTAWQLHAPGETFQCRPLPDLPHPIGYAVAAIARDRLYVIGGLAEPASKSPSTEMWSLDLRAVSKASAWKREPDLPTPGVFVGAAASDAQNIYLIGGMTYDAHGKPTPSKRMLRFNAARAAWEKLADLPEPRVGAVTPCPLLSPEKIFVIGGYAEVFPGPPREYPGFRDQTFFYDLRRNAWENGPLIPKADVPNRDSPGDPGPAPMIAAPCTIWQNCVVVIGGEVRASVRTPCVIAWPLDIKSQ